MHNNLKNITKSVFKISVIITTYSFIIYKLIDEKSILYLSEFLEGFNISSAFLLVTVFGLMIINWSLEAYKWKLLVSKYELISLKNAIKSVFAGISVGIFTPNRIGEIGGRALLLKKENRIKSMSSSILGSISQSVVTFIFGILSLFSGLLFYSNQFNLFLSSNFIAIMLLMSVLTIIVLLIYFNINRFSALFEKKSFLRKYSTHFNFIKTYTKFELFEILSYSFFRYIIYVTQFFLLLIFFETEISVFEAYISISITYLIVSLIPSIVLADLGIRGTVSLFIIGLFTSSETGIIPAAFLIWLINLVLPSIVGSVIFYRTKI